MRAPVPSSSWLNETSRLSVAVTSLTGTCTSPKPTEPLQIELGTPHLPDQDPRLRSLLRGKGTIVRVDCSPWSESSRADGYEDRCRQRSRSRSRAAGSASPTSTRSSTPKPASPKPTSSTTTAGSPRCCSPIWPGRVPTLVRAPDGPDGQIFFEKRCPGHRPKWVNTAHRWADTTATADSRAASSTTCPTLVWVANLAALELHTYQATVDDLELPDRDGDRPRPGRAGHDRRLRRGRARPPRRCSTSSGSSGREDVGIEGPAPVGAAEHAGRHRRRHEELRARRRPAARVARSETGHDGDGEGTADGRVFVDWSQNDRAQDDGRRRTRCASGRGRGCRRHCSWDEVEAVHDSGDGDRADVRRAAPRSNASRSSATSTQTNLTLEQELPVLKGAAS